MGSIINSIGRGLHGHRYLLVTLVVVYLAMVLLSAVEMRGGSGPQGAWRWTVPRFVVQTGPGGEWFFNDFNQRKILEQAAINMTLGVGMTFVILTGGIDLSVGSLLALCNVVFVSTMLAVRGSGDVGAEALALALGACLVTGTLAGAVNGWLAVGLRIPSFIVTLGTLLIVRGVAYWVSGGETKLLACPSHLTVGIPIGVSLLAVVLGGVFLSTTAMGRRVYAVGGNAQASAYAGVRTDRVRVMCFAFSGFCAGLAGMIYWSRVATGSYTAGEGAELYAIAAVVLGGTRLAGGQGTMIGTMIGALIMAVLANGLNTASVHELTQKIIVGAVLIAAAAVDSRRGRSLTPVA